MNPDEILLENLPPEIKVKLKELALTLGRSEEELASEIVQLVIQECEQPEGGTLKTFVRDAKAALKKNSP